MRICLQRIALEVAEHDCFLQCFAELAFRPLSWLSPKS